MRARDIAQDCRLYIIYIVPVGNVSNIVHLSFVLLCMSHLFWGGHRGDGATAVDRASKMKPPPQLHVGISIEKLNSDFQRPPRAVRLTLSSVHMFRFHVNFSTEFCFDVFQGGKVANKEVQYGHCCYQIFRSHGIR